MKQSLELLESLKSGLIVSCQAPVNSPLHDPLVIAAMAKAALNGGAVGVRIDTPAHVAGVRQNIGKFPIIGLWKQQISGFEVYITPRFADAVAIATAGADIIAIDGTLRPRPNGESLSNLIKKIHQELGKLVMADVDTMASASAAVEAGADILGTTLYGYTADTSYFSPPGWNLLSEMLSRFSIPVICEGGVASPQMAVQALQLGAYAVVIGNAITGIDQKVEQFRAVFP